MNGRERFLCAFRNEKPDRLPVQVHSWMSYYLNRYLNGMDQYQAYDAVGMSTVIYEEPKYIFKDSDFNSWQIKRRTWKKNGEDKYECHIITPDGELVEKAA